MVRLPDDRLRRPERLAVIGAGYIGLPTAAGFADLGYEVVCADTNPTKLARLLAGQVDLHEPDLQDLVQRGLRTRRLAFCNSPAAAAREAKHSATVTNERTMKRCEGTHARLPQSRRDQSRFLESA